VPKDPILIGRPSLLRRTNATNILKLLRETGPCSRADLVRASGLSAPSVTNVVAHLAAAGLIEPIGEGESSGGRPPDMLRFKADRGCLAGVDISAGRIRFLLTDLNGQHLGSVDTSLPRQSATPRAVCAHIGETIRSLLRKHKQKPEQLLAVVAGVPAITNVEEGIVLAISTLKGWRRVPLRTLLEKEFACPVLIENDTNLAAQGERYCGAARGEDNFVFISIGEGEGVGSGIVLNGKIYHGSQWSAGNRLSACPRCFSWTAHHSRFWPAGEDTGRPGHFKKLALERKTKNGTAASLQRSGRSQPCGRRKCLRQADSYAKNSNAQRCDSESFSDPKPGTHSSGRRDWHAPGAACRSEEIADRQ
jgi:DNA-binding transcriptional ArsR family regulator